MGYRIRDDRCPYCEGSEFIKGKHEGYGAVQSLESVWLSQTLYHVICRQCGSVVRSYVQNPEKLIKRRNRNDTI